MDKKDNSFSHEPHISDQESDNDFIDAEYIPSRSRRLLENTDYHVITHDVENLPQGLHHFGEFGEVYWTDAAIDAATSVGRAQIAATLGINLDQIISFSAAKHTNEVVIVDRLDGIQRVDTITDEETGRELEAGWSEPLSPKEDNPNIGVERKTYDGIILVGKDNFKDNYLLVTGADCTSVGVRGALKTGEEFIAIVHGGRKGTMTGVMDNLAKRLQWLGAVANSLELFVGPAAQAIEVPLEILEQEGADNNSWREGAISDEYVKDDVRKVLYNNQFDSVRRLVENLGVSGEGVHVMDIDTVAEDSRGKLHSYRRDKTAERNSLIIGFKKI